MTERVRKIYSGVVFRDFVGIECGIRFAVFCTGAMQPFAGFAEAFTTRSQSVF